MKILALFIFFISTFSISAQSFWKISGVESAANAQHSGILYSPYRNAIYVQIKEPPGIMFGSSRKISLSPLCLPLRTEPF